MAIYDGVLLADHGCSAPVPLHPDSAPVRTGDGLFLSAFLSAREFLLVYGSDECSANRHQGIGNVAIHRVVELWMPGISCNAIVGQGGVTCGPMIHILVVSIRR